MIVRATKPAALALVATLACAAAFAQQPSPNLDLEAVKRVFGAAPDSNVAPAAPTPAATALPLPAPTESAGGNFTPRPPVQAKKPSSGDLAPSLDDALRNPPPLDAAARALMARQALAQISSEAQSRLDRFDRSALLRRLQAAQAEVDAAAPTLPQASSVAPTAAPAAADAQPRHDPTPPDEPKSAPP